MSVTSGFFNSLNGDRKYNAEQLSSIFNGIINDGIFQSIGTAFAVSADTGNSIKVGIGRAWFNGAWIYNDSILEMTASGSEQLLDRWDAVVIEVDQSDAVRNGSIKFVVGTPASTPVKPTMVSSTYVHQYPLAYIYRKKASTEITQADITNMIGSSSCPYSNGVMATQNTDKIVAQWQAEFNSWIAKVQSMLDEKGQTADSDISKWDSEFHTWLSNLRAVLDSDTATKLTAEMLDLKDFDSNITTENIVQKTNYMYYGANRNYNNLFGRNLGQYITDEQMGWLTDTDKTKLNNFQIGDYWQSATQHVTYNNVVYDYVIIYLIADKGYFAGTSIVDLSGNAINTKATLNIIDYVEYIGDHGVPPKSITENIIGYGQWKTTALPYPYYPGYASTGSPLSTNHLAGLLFNGNSTTLNAHITKYYDEIVSNGAMDMLDIHQTLKVRPYNDVIVNGNSPVVLKVDGPKPSTEGMAGDIFYNAYVPGMEDEDMNPPDPTDKMVFAKTSLAWTASNRFREVYSVACKNTKLGATGNIIEMDMNALQIFERPRGVDYADFPGCCSSYKTLSYFKLFGDRLLQPDGSHLGLSNIFTRDRSITYNPLKIIDATRIQLDWSAEGTSNYNAGRLAKVFTIY